MKGSCNIMVIIRKDLETKEIEIPGFRKILKDPKNPDYKELKIYIKNGWIPVDPEDDQRELQKVKKRKINAKKNKERRPSYAEMENNIQKLDNRKMLDEFNAKRNIKNNYNNVLKWYNKEVKNIQNGEDKTSLRNERELISEAE